MPTLIETLRNANIEFKRHGEDSHVSNGWLGLKCPQCGTNSSKFHFGFEINTGRANCWKCGKLDAVEVLSELCGISLRDAATILRQSPSVRDDKRSSPVGRLALPHAGDLLDAHRNYLEDRKFDPDEIIRLWGVKGIGPLGNLKWRILIPICDRFGKTVSWTTRTIGKAEPKYWSASPEQESTHHKDILYGSQYARHSVVVCEGPISAWGVGPGAVATCGVGYTSAQLYEISQYPIRAICFDAEKDAQRRADELCRELAAFPGVTENILLETGNDPAEAERDEILEIREKYLK